MKSLEASGCGRRGSDWHGAAVAVRAAGATDRILCMEDARPASALHCLAAHGPVDVSGARGAGPGTAGAGHARGTRGVAGGGHRGGRGRRRVAGAAVAVEPAADSAARTRANGCGRARAAPDGGV
eukprot:ctg_1623.g518